MPSKVVTILIQFKFLGINIFWALPRAHFNPHLMAWAKMSLSQAQNIFMPMNIKSIALLNKVTHIRIIIIIKLGQKAYPLCITQYLPHSFSCFVCCYASHDWFI